MFPLHARANRAEFPRCGAWRRSWTAKGNEMSVTIVARVGVICAVATLVFAGCSGEPTEESEVPDALSLSDVAALAPTPELAVEMSAESRYVEIGQFRGHVNPTDGTFEIEMLPRAVAQVAEDDGVRTRVQAASYCEFDVEGDDVPGTNPPDTLEFYTDETSVHAGLAGNTGEINACKTGDYVGDGALFNNNPDDVPASERHSTYDALGVFCGDVRVINFYSQTLTNTYAEITEFSGEVNQNAYLCTRGNYFDCLGTGAHAPTQGYDAPGNSLGAVVVR